MSHVCDGQCDYSSTIRTVAKSDTSDTDIVAFTGSSGIVWWGGCSGAVEGGKVNAFKTSCWTTDTFPCFSC